MEGGRRQYDRPDWGPLEDVLCSDDLCAQFMWMGDIELGDATIVNEYKHRWTRQYLHLSVDGRALGYVGEDRYEEVDLVLALGTVFLYWECIDPTAEERLALWSALHKAMAAAE